MPLRGIEAFRKPIDDLLLARLGADWTDILSAMAPDQLLRHILISSFLSAIAQCQSTKVRVPRSRLCARE